MLDLPSIPEYITVHLGVPNADAENITIPFIDYIKNVASSTSLPTWDDDALRSNIYAIITFALSRIGTKWYRERGYQFDITNNINYDQPLVAARDIFDNVSVLVDEIFNSYIRQKGETEPLPATMCSPEDENCNGFLPLEALSLAKENYTTLEILQKIYGDNIEIVKDLSLNINQPAFEGIPLALGMNGTSVANIQTQLNRISSNYRSIPKIPDITGFFDEYTKNAVMAFQKIFNLPITGIVDSATWYRIALIYSSIKRLASIYAESVNYEDIIRQFLQDLKLTMTDKQVELLQYYLTFIGAYYNRISPVDITGYFGPQTEASVRTFQRVFGLPRTGVVDQITWNELNNVYQGIIESLFLDNPNLISLPPDTILKEGMTNEYIKALQEYLSLIHNSIPSIPAVKNTGYFGPITKTAVTTFQKQYGLQPNGIVGAETWNKIASVYSDLYYGAQKQPYQFPGYTMQ